MTLIFLLLEMACLLGWALTLVTWPLGVCLGLIVCQLAVLGIGTEELERDVRKLDPPVKQVEDEHVVAGYGDYTKD